MSYTPKTRQPQPAAAETAALSPALAAALERADELLAERNRTYAMVVETHYLYPDLLRQRADAQAALNAAELHGNPATLQAARAKFAEVETEARHALSRRNGGLEFLIGQERVLLQAQESLDSARGTYTSLRWRRSRRGTPRPSSYSKRSWPKPTPWAMPFASMCPHRRRIR